MFSIDIPPLNPLAIIAVVVLHFVIGALWYSPVLFSKAWQAELPENKRKGSLAEGMSITVIGGAVAFVVMAILVGYTGSASFLSGAKIGFFVWLLALLVGAQNMAYSGSSRKLLLIDYGYILLSYVLAGAILAGWR